MYTVLNITFFKKILKLIKMIVSKRFFLKYWIFIFLTFLTTGFISIYFINKNQTRGENLNLLKIPLLSLSTYQIKNQPNYSFLEKNFPQFQKEAWVFETKKQIFNNDEAIIIADKFNFKKEPIIEQDQNSNNIFYFWESEEFGNLSINLNKGEFNYTSKKGSGFMIPGRKRNLSSLNDAEDFAWNFIKEKGLLPLSENINLTLIKNQYYKDMESEIKELNSSQEADFIGLFFENKINNIKVKGVITNLFLGENLEVLQFNYSSLFSELKELGLYPLKNKNEILQVIKNNKTINDLKFIGDQTIIENDSQNIKSVDLDKIELVYLKTDIPQSYLQPIFFISGQAVLNDGRVAEVGIYLPAIKDQYLLK